MPSQYVHHLRILVQDILVASSLEKCLEVFSILFSATEAEPAPRTRVRWGLVSLRVVGEGLAV